MSNFRDRDTSRRLVGAGQMAERKVEELGRRRNRPLVRFGPAEVATDRDQTSTWPRHIRHAPDYLQFARFVEVQGCYDDYVYFKTDKLDDLEGFWNLQMPVWFAIYIQSTDEVLYCDLASVRWATWHPTTTMTTFDEGTRGEKAAFRVELRVLLERMVKDAFDADRVQNKGKAKRTANREAA